jgi:hypothetical protein
LEGQKSPWISSKCEYNKVSVKPKDIEVSDPVTASTDKKQQKILIADAAILTATLTLWESNIGKLQLSDT